MGVGFGVGGLGVGGLGVGGLGVGVGVDVGDGDSVGLELGVDVGVAVGVAVSVAVASAVPLGPGLTPSVWVTPATGALGDDSLAAPEPGRAIASSTTSSRTAAAITSRLAWVETWRRFLDVTKRGSGRGTDGPCGA